MTEELERRLRSQLPALADLRLEEPASGGSSDVGGNRRDRRLALVLAAFAMLILGGAIYGIRAQIDSETDSVAVSGTIDTPLEVSMQVYSGVPNPVWLLTPAEQDEFLALLARLPEAESPAPEPSPVLGFTGFMLAPTVGGSSMLTGGSPSMRVIVGSNTKQVVVVDERGGKRHLQDEDGAALALLARSGLAHLDAPSLREILTPLAAN